MWTGNCIILTRESSAPLLIGWKWHHSRVTMWWCQAFLAGALFSFTTSPHLSLFSLSLLLWCGFSAPFANNTHYTPYFLFPLSFISLLFSFRTSFAALALLPCEKPCMQAHVSPPIADSWMTSSSPPPPAASSSDHIQHTPKPTVRMGGRSFIAQMMCSYTVLLTAKMLSFVLH